MSLPDFWGEFGFRLFWGLCSIFFGSDLQPVHSSDLIDQVQFLSGEAIRVQLIK